MTDKPGANEKDDSRPEHARRADRPDERLRQFERERGLDDEPAAEDGGPENGDEDDEAVPPGR